MMYEIRVTAIGPDNTRGHSVANEFNEFEIDEIIEKLNYSYFDECCWDDGYKGLAIKIYDLFVGHKLCEGIHKSIKLELMIDKNTIVGDLLSDIECMDGLISVKEIKSSG